MNTPIHPATHARQGHTMRKTLLLQAVAAAAASTALPAAADFTGAAAPGNFTVANVGTLVGSAPAPGTATFSTAQLLLRGGNTAGTALGCTGGVYSTLTSPCQLQVTLNLPGTYSFNWSYATADADGPGGDIFGVVVDGTRIAVSDLGGAVGQLGSASFVAGSSFGWFLNCTDCIGGIATATVSSFVLSPVPEPASQALLLAGGAAVAGVVAARRRWPNAREPVARKAA